MFGSCSLLLMQIKGLRCCPRDLCLGVYKDLVKGPLAGSFI